MPTSTTAWEDSQGGLWNTEAEAIAADNEYNANLLFEALLDEERQILQYATLDDLVAQRIELEAIFAALDGA